MRRLAESSCQANALQEATNSAPPQNVAAVIVESQSLMCPEHPKLTCECEAWDRGAPVWRSMLVDWRVEWSAPRFLQRICQRFI